MGHRSSIGSWLGAAAGWAVLLVAAIVTWLRLQPPQAVPASASTTAFSAERAARHLEHFARAPHPTGSPEAAEARAYIVGYLQQLGLHVEVERALSCTKLAGLRQCGVVHNVLASSPGRDSSSAVLLSAHYDTVPNAPGAADDGASVAALLEAARAVSSGAPLRHDVLWAFVDGEEELLLGSTALARRSGPLSRVRVAANFEARGSSGATALVAVSKGSGAIIEQFARATSRPVASSLYCALASVLPNGTDAEAYDRAGVKTLSFAFADGLETYHQKTDAIEHLDLRSLQHSGQLALEFARTFGDSQLPALSEASGETVFFDVFGLFVVRYSYWVARGTALVAVLLVFVLCRRALETRAATRSAILGAAWRFIASVSLTGLSAWLGDAALTWGWPRWAPGAHRAALTGCIAAFAVGFLIRAQASAARRLGPSAVALGPMLVWGLAALITALFAPATSHVFVWPLLGTVCFSLAPARTRPLALAGFLPVVSFGVQVGYSLLVVLGTAIAPAVCVAWFGGLLVGTFDARGERSRLASLWLLRVGAILAAFLVVVGRSARAPASGDSVAYAVNTLDERAHWVSGDAELDPHTRQFLGPSAVREQRADLASPVPLFEASAPFQPLPAPQLELLSQTELNGLRKIRLRVRSNRGARAIVLWEATGATFADFQFEGVRLEPIVRFSEALDEKLFRLATGVGYPHWTVLLLGLPSEGATLTFSTREPQTLEFRALDRSEGLPFVPASIKGRDARMTLGPPGDQTWVTTIPLHVRPRAPGEERP